jgi:hypothetical protein
VTAAAHVLQGFQHQQQEPLCIDLFCGSFGWSQGWLELGGRVIGFDLDHQDYHGPVPRGADLILQDVRTIDGARFKDVTLILSSSPCQEFSYRAMPWKKAKALGPPVLGLELFAQAFRIQREAIAAAGHFIPMVQENVRGANPWVRELFGRSRWSYGSYHLWGDVPALMPITLGCGRKVKMASWRHPSDPRHVPGQGFNTLADRQTRALPDHMKVGELNWRDHGKPGYKGDQLQDVAAAQYDDSVKCGGPAGDDWFTHHNRPEFDRRAGLSVPVECRGCGASAVMSSGTIEADLNEFKRTHSECVGSEVIVGKAEAHDRATKNSGGSWFNIAHNTESGANNNPARGNSVDGVKVPGLADGHFPPGGLAQGHIDGVEGFTPDRQPLGKNVLARKHGSKSSARKAASARIAKIPLALARHIARTYFPADARRINAAGSEGR